MATITLRLSAKSDKATSQHEILMRFRHGSIDQYAPTNVFVLPKHWDEKKQSIKITYKNVQSDEQKQEAYLLQESSDRLNEIKSLVQKSFQVLDKSNKPEKDWLKNLIHDFNFPPQPEEDEQAEQQMLDVLSKYINSRDYSISRIRHFKVIWRTIKRFELYKGLSLTLDNVTDETLRTFEQFVKDEHKLCERTSYKKILDAVPESRTPQPRGKNAINNIMRYFRTFYKWAVKNEYTTNDPFKKFEITECVYGTPVYLTVEERNRLYKANFSRHERISRQRDIFVFQCVIGCRVSDLWSMTKANVVNGAIEYIPRKTKEGDPVTVRVPLNAIALEILEKYKDIEGDQLLPFTSQQHYNKDIKTMFMGAGLNRIVTILNPTTREPEQHPLWEVASSHMARRCFIGNLYKKVKDPNAIGALSGHVEGSKAFARYRAIDEDIKKEMVTMLE